MSFFGFDTSLPQDDRAAALAHGEDHALKTKISKALAASAQEDVEVYTWGQDGYDGLGDQLEETNDDLNEDTFGTFAEDVGKDFDFGHAGGAPAQSTTTRDKNASAFAASLDDFWSTPSFTAPPPKAQPVHAPAPIPVPAPVPAHAPASAPAAVPAPQAAHARPRTVEEVEAELRARRNQTQRAPALSLEQIEAQMRSERAAAARPPGIPQGPAPVPPVPTSFASAAAAGVPVPPAPGLPGAPVLPPGLDRAQPPAPAQAQAPVSAPAQAPAQPQPQPQAQRAPEAAEPENPQAAHYARMRAMLAACPPAVQQAVLALAPPIQFGSLEEVVQRFPTLVVEGVKSDEQAAIQWLVSQAPARLQEWERASAKQRSKTAKLAYIARYNGIMSGADKDFITRIQISQLVSADPYEGDFYAHVFFAVRGGGRQIALPDPSSMAAIQARKEAEQSGRASRQKLTKHENAMLRMQQQVERLVENRKKREAQHGESALSGALGRVSSKTANKPRQMLQLIHRTEDAPTARLDTATKDEQQDAMRIAMQGASLGENVDAALGTDGPQQRRKPLTNRQTLLILERLYSQVLALEQLRRKGEEGVEQQPALLDQIWQELRVLEPLDISDPHPFVALLNHVKGKRLLPRVVRLLNTEQSLTVLTMLVASFQTLDAVSLYPTFEQLRATGRVHEGAYARDLERTMEAFSNAVLFFMLGLIANAPLRIVSGMLALLMERNDIVAVSKTRPGVSLLTALLSRAEALRQASDARPDPAELEQWVNVFGVLLDRLAHNAQLPELFPSTRVRAAVPFGADYMFNNMMRGNVFDNDVEDEPVWNLAALLAIHSNLAQQQVLVQELRGKILANVLAAKEAASRALQEGRTPLSPNDDVRIRNVNLLLHALNLDAAQITL
ncbi:DNA topoisomerase 2-associated protein pat1 [Malassezia cuniculi]|uniref:DNA topoisomerase 2-associated protein pat1 n=1 Tax=Malassezia cuniculi TaxID=948313 RepID=A0AAF0EQW5_9BASI|nr:DNA topoisomerase 2-associated protein pat1 [Malassezia cuniculi]